MAPIEILLFRKGSSTPFSEWLASLRDVRAVAIVRARLNRIRLGNFGDCKSVGGGVEEFTNRFRPWLSNLLRREGALVVILICGGNKRTQARDIVNAQKQWKEYLDGKIHG